MGANGAGKTTFLPTLDLLLAQPISRTSTYLQKAAAVAVANRVGPAEMAVFAGTCALALAAGV